MFTRLTHKYSEEVTGIGLNSTPNNIHIHYLGKVTLTINKTIKRLIKSTKLSQQQILHTSDPIIRFTSTSKDKRIWTYPER